MATGNNGVPNAHLGMLFCALIVGSSFHVVTDELLLDAEGNSTISMEDLAVVLLDEAEQPRHHRTRFTTAY